MASVIYHPDVIDLSWLNLPSPSGATWEDYIRAITEAGAKKKKTIVLNLYRQYRLLVLGKKEVGIVLFTRTDLNIILYSQSFNAVDIYDYIMFNANTPPSDSVIFSNVTLFDIDTTTTNVFGQYTSDPLLQESKYFFSVIGDNSNKSTTPLFFYADSLTITSDLAQAAIDVIVTDLFTYGRLFPIFSTYVAEVFSEADQIRGFDLYIPDSAGNLFETDTHGTFQDYEAIYYLSGNFTDPGTIFNTLKIETAFDLTLDLIRTHADRSYFQFSTTVVPQALPTVDVTIFEEIVSGALSGTTITGTFPVFGGAQSALDGLPYTIYIERTYPPAEDGSYLIEGVLAETEFGNISPVATISAFVPTDIYSFTAPVGTTGGHIKNTTNGLYFVSSPYLWRVDSPGSLNMSETHINWEGTITPSTLVPSSTAVLSGTDAGGTETGTLDWTFSYRYRGVFFTWTASAFAIAIGAVDPNITYSASIVFDQEAQSNSGPGGTFTGGSTDANNHIYSFRLYETFFGDTFIATRSAENRVASNFYDQTLDIGVLENTRPTSFEELIDATYFPSMTLNSFGGAEARNEDIYINNATLLSATTTKTYVFYDILQLGGSQFYDNCYLSLSFSGATPINSYVGPHKTYIDTKFADDPSINSVQNLVMPHMDLIEKRGLPGSYVGFGAPNFYYLIYLMDSSFNKTGFCYFYITAAITTILNSYIDELVTVTNLVPTLQGIPKEEWPAGAQDTLENAEFLRGFLDSHFDSINMPANDFMSYSLMHYIVERGPLSSIIYITIGD